MDKRNIYIDNIEMEEALKIFFDSLELPIEIEKINVLESVGRVTAEGVFAKFCSPSYSASAMDGILLFSKKTEGASEMTPIYLEENIDFTYVNTGNSIDYNLGDSVIMIEELIEEGNGKFKIIKSAKPWQHIRPIGEDIIQGEMILKSNHRITPQDLGALISSGNIEIDVLRKPTVGILATGDEVIDLFKEEYKEKSVIDCNSYVFSALVKDWNGTPTVLPKVKDSIEDLTRELKAASEKFDVVIVNAGSSAGSKDYTKFIIEKLGEVVVHGVAVKPGKPTILGEINKKPVIGIPGYPVSAFLSMEIFVKPLLEKLTSIEKETEYIDAKISKTVVSSLKHKEFVRVTLHYSKDELIATPLLRGAGITTSLSKADGILEIPKNVEGINGGTNVKIRLLKPLKEIKDYLVSVGSHDVVMDLIGDKIKLCSTHVGSFGGILAIKNRTTHIAPIHILDEKTGEYNIEILRKYFPNKEVTLIKGVTRTQGIIVEKGNPHNITSVKDIIDKKVKFINRQKGAGTRILLDYLLEKLDEDRDKIDGYEREANTHLEVAMGIKTGTAQAGLGIKEAANITEQDFIPLLEEEYDFIVLKENLESEKIKEFINFLKSDYFKSKIASIDGYGEKEIGKIIDI